MCSVPPLISYASQHASAASQLCDRAQALTMCQTQMDTRQPELPSAPKSSPQRPLVKKVHCTFSALRLAPKPRNAPEKQRDRWKQHKGLQSCPPPHTPHPTPNRFKDSIKKCLVRHRVGVYRALPLALEPPGPRQEMFAAVASVRLTRHDTRICSLGMLLRFRRPGCRTLMLRRALYYI